MAKEDMMPAELRGCMLTQTLKSGAMLRTAYNVDACAKDPEDCEGRWACGGRHPAKECKGTRALTATRFQQMQQQQLEKG